jgi:hypothetical protein
VHGPAADAIAPGHVSHARRVLKDFEHPLYRCSTRPSSTSTATSFVSPLAHSEGVSWIDGADRKVSPTYRSQCRPAAGAGPGKCRAGTGARVSCRYRTSTMSRDITRERATGIEPAFSAWEADVLPLNYARENPANLHAGQTPTGCGAAPPCATGCPGPPTGKALGRSREAGFHQRPARASNRRRR